jgi:hypothetical protein
MSDRDEAEAYRQPVGDGAMPGAGVGRREDVRGSGVHPASDLADADTTADVPIVMAGHWGGGPYEEAGDSGIFSLESIGRQAARDERAHRREPGPEKPA